MKLMLYIYINVLTVYVPIFPSTYRVSFQTITFFNANIIFTLLYIIL